MERDKEKTLLVLGGEIKSPPLSSQARVEAGYLIRQLQQGLGLSLPHSRPMPRVGKQCHELRIRDADRNWRVLYHIDDEFIVVLDVFNKTTEQTPDAVIDVCKRRLSKFFADKEEQKP